MGILDKIKKEEPSLSNLDSKQNIFKRFAVLQDKQIEDFIRNVIRSSSSYESLIDKAYKNTGKKALTQKIKGTHMYEIVKKIKKYPDAAHIAGFEALLRALWPISGNLPGEELEFGQGEFFNEEGFVIKYHKEEPLYKRKGRYGVEGIIQVLYQAPIGSFIIEQNKINDKIFEIYVSETISKELLQELNIALAKTLELEIGSREEQFRRELNVKVEHPSLDRRQQKEVKSNIVPGIGDSQGGISH